MKRLKFMVNQKNRNLWILVILVAACIRFVGLGLNPVGLTHDEVHQFVYAKSVLFTGHGAGGTGAGVLDNNPHCDGNCVFGELPSIALVPFAALPLGFPWLKLPFILLSLGLVFVVGKLFENLFNSKKIGLITGLLMAINPWAVFFGRSAYENIFSFFLYFLGILIVVSNFKSFKYQFTGVFVLFLASLGYFGAKVWYLPILAATIFYCYFKEKQKNWKKYFILFIFGLGLFGLYMFFLSKSFAGLRMKEVQVDWPKIQAEVDTVRKMTFDFPLKSIFINKYTVFSKNSLERYFTPLSPNYLFNVGEQGYDHFMIAGHPFFYLLDIIGIFFGLFLIFETSFASGLYLVALLAISPLPGAVSNYASTYALRAGMLYPILVGLSGAGWVFLFGRINKGKSAFKFAVIFLYLLSFVYFLFMYWYRNPIEKSNGWVFYEREASKYIQLLDEGGYDNKIVVVAKDPVDFLYEWGIWSKKFNDKDFILKLNRAVSDRTYQVDQVSVIKNCPGEYEKGVVYLVFADVGCTSEKAEARLSDPKDSGTKVFIVNELLCDKNKISMYPRPLNIQDFNISKINEEDFCARWVSKP